MRKYFHAGDVVRVKTSYLSLKPWTLIEWIVCDDGPQYEYGPRIHHDDNRPDGWEADFFWPHKDVEIISSTRNKHEDIFSNQTQSTKRRCQEGALLIENLPSSRMRQ